MLGSLNPPIVTSQLCCNNSFTNLPIYHLSLFFYYFLVALLPCPCMLLITTMILYSLLRTISLYFVLSSCCVLYSFVLCYMLALCYVCSGREERLLPAAIKKSNQIENPLILKSTWADISAAMNTRKQSA